MENISKVNICTLDLDMASVISRNSRENLYAFLKRMNLDVEVHWEKEALALVLKDTILENPEYILAIYGREIIEYLIEIWESEYLDMEQNDWAVIGQLGLLGFLEFHFDEKENEHSIYVVKEAKDAFYFYLKSKTAKMMMDRYDTWEALVRGMMVHYGIISFGRLYYHFCRLIKSPVDDTEFHRFLSVRIDLLQFGGFALEKTSNVEYYQNYEISAPETVLDKRMELKEVDYFCPAYEDAIYIAENNGIGRWDGITTLAEVFLQLLDIEYYKTVVAIKTCILMMQNDEKIDAVEEFLFTAYPECRPFQDKIRGAVRSLYDSVPVYSLKGYNRKEIRKKQRAVPAFTVIKGGKSGREKKGGNQK